MSARHFLDEPCLPTCGDDCPVRAARENRKVGKEGLWGALELREEPEGLRHYLEEEPVHCGALLELQSIGYKVDDFGEYTVALHQGIIVRYEAVFSSNIRVTLHANVGGHEFVTGLQSWMRFRWSR